MATRCMLKVMATLLMAVLLPWTVSFSATAAPTAVESTPALLWTVQTPMLFRNWTVASSVLQTQGSSWQSSYPTENWSWWSPDRLVLTAIVSLPASYPVSAAGSLAGDRALYSSIEAAVDLGLRIALNLTQSALDGSPNPALSSSIVYRGSPTTAKAIVSYVLNTASPSQLTGAIATSFLRQASSAEWSSIPAQLSSTTRTRVAAEVARRSVSVGTTVLVPAGGLAVEELVLQSEASFNAMTQQQHGTLVGNFSKGLEPQYDQGHLPRSRYGARAEGIVGIVGLVLFGLLSLGTLCWILKGGKSTAVKAPTETTAHHRQSMLRQVVAAGAESKNESSPAQVVVSGGQDKDSDKQNSNLNVEDEHHTEGLDLTSDAARTDLPLPKVECSEEEAVHFSNSTDCSEEKGTTPQETGEGVPVVTNDVFPPPTDDTPEELADLETKDDESSVALGDQPLTRLLPPALLALFVTFVVLSSGLLASAPAKDPVPFAVLATYLGEQCDGSSVAQLPSRVLSVEADGECRQALGAHLDVKVFLKARCYSMGRIEIAAGTSLSECQQSRFVSSGAPNCTSLDHTSPLSAQNWFPLHAQLWGTPAFVTLQCASSDTLFHTLGLATESWRSLRTSVDSVSRKQHSTPPLPDADGVYSNEALLVVNVSAAAGSVPFQRFLGQGWSSAGVSPRYVSGSIRSPRNSSSAAKRIVTVRFPFPPPASGPYGGGGTMGINSDADRDLQLTPPIWVKNVAPKGVADVGSLKEFTLEQWVVLSRASRGFVLAVADHWIVNSTAGVGAEGVPLSMPTLPQLARGLREGAKWFDATWKVYYALYVDGLEGTLSLAFATPELGVGEARWELRRLGVDIFDGTAHHLAIRSGNPKYKNRFQLFVDGKTDYSVTGWQRCLPRGVDSLPEVEVLPSSVRITRPMNETPSSFGDVPVMLIGALLEGTEVGELRLSDQRETDRNLLLRADGEVTANVSASGSLALGIVLLVLLASVIVLNLIRLVVEEPSAQRRGEMLDKMQAAGKGVADAAANSAAATLPTASAGTGQLISVGLEFVSVSQTLDIFLSGWTWPALYTIPISFVIWLPALDLNLDIFDVPKLVTPAIQLLIAILALLFCFQLLKRDNEKFIAQLPRMKQLVSGEVQETVPKQHFWLELEKLMRISYTHPITSQLVAIEDPDELLEFVAAVAVVTTPRKEFRKMLRKFSTQDVAEEESGASFSTDFWLTFDVTQKAFSIEHRAQHWKTSVKLEYVQPRYCPLHSKNLLICALEREHLRQQLECKVKGVKQPYCCIYSDLPFGPARAKPCDIDAGFLVCSHESCSYTVCENCADLSAKNKAIVKAATKAYEWRDSTAFIGMIVVALLEALYVPIAKNAAMILRCHRDYQCEFPECYASVSVAFGIAIFFASVLLLSFGLALPCYIFYLLYLRKRAILQTFDLLKKREAQDLRQGVNETEEELSLANMSAMAIITFQIPDEDWSNILQFDNSILRSVYASYEMRYMWFQPLSLFFKLAGVLIVVMSVPESLHQLVLTGTVAMVQVFLLSLTAPFIDPWIDGLTTMGLNHHVVQLALMAFYRIGNANWLPILMLCISGVYAIVMIVVIVVLVRQILQRSKQQLIALGPHAALQRGDKETFKSIASLTPERLLECDWAKRSCYHYLVLSDLPASSEEFTCYREQLFKAAELQRKGQDDDAAPSSGTTAARELELQYLTSEDQFGFSPLEYAVRLGAVDRLEALLIPKELGDLDASPMTNSFGDEFQNVISNLFLEAVKFGSLASLNWIAERFVHFRSWLSDDHCLDPDGETPILVAARECKVEIIERLLELDEKWTELDRVEASEKVLSSGAETPQDRTRKKSYFDFGYPTRSGGTVFHVLARNDFRGTLPVRVKEWLGPLWGAGRTHSESLLTSVCKNGAETFLRELLKPVPEPEPVEVLTTLRIKRRAQLMERMEGGPEDSSLCSGPIWHAAISYRSACFLILAEHGFIPTSQRYNFLLKATTINHQLNKFRIDALVISIDEVPPEAHLHRVSMKYPLPGETIVQAPNVESIAVADDQVPVPLHGCSVVLTLDQLRSLKGWTLQAKWKGHQRRGIRFVGLEDVIGNLLTSGSAESAESVSCVGTFPEQCAAAIAACTKKNIAAMGLYKANSYRLILAYDDGSRPTEKGCISSLELRLYTTHFLSEFFDTETIKNSSFEALWERKTPEEWATILEASERNGIPGMACVSNEKYCNRQQVHIATSDSPSGSGIAFSQTTGCMYGRAFFKLPERQGDPDADGRLAPAAVELQPCYRRHALIAYAAQFCKESNSLNANRIDPERLLRVAMDEKSALLWLVALKHYGADWLETDHAQDMIAQRWDLGLYLWAAAFPYVEMLAWDFWIETGRTNLVLLDALYTNNVWVRMLQAAEIPLITLVGSEEVYNWFLEHGFLVNMEGRDHQGDTALHIAAVSQGPKFFRWLQETFPDGEFEWTIRNHRGLTPFQIAAENRNLELVKYFVDNNVAELQNDPNPEDGMRAEHYAARVRRPDILALLPRDQCFSSLTHDGKLPIHFSVTDLTTFTWFIEQAVDFDRDVLMPDHKPPVNFWRTDGIFSAVLTAAMVPIDRALTTSSDDPEVLSVKAAALRRWDSLQRVSSKARPLLHEEELTPDFAAFVSAMIRCAQLVGPEAVYREVLSPAFRSDKETDGLSSALNGLVRSSQLEKATKFLDLPGLQLGDCLDGGVLQILLELQFLKDPGLRNSTKVKRLDATATFLQRLVERSVCIFEEGRKVEEGELRREFWKQYGALLRSSIGNLCDYNAVPLVRILWDAGYPMQQVDSETGNSLLHAIYFRWIQNLNDPESDVYTLAWGNTLPALVEERSAEVDWSVQNAAGQSLSNLRAALEEARRKPAESAS